MSVMSSSKLGSEAKLLLAQADGDADREARVEVLVRLNDVDADVHSTGLRDLDADARLVAGDIARLTLRVGDLERLAALDDVISVELSRPLATEAEPEPDVEAGREDLGRDIAPGEEDHDA
jgi:hypothetical protein